MDGRDLPGSLERLEHSLAQTATLLHESHDTEWDRLLGLVGALLEALRTVAGTLLRRSDSSVPAVGLSTWLHAVRERITAITGWTSMMTRMRDETKRVQAREAIERNAAALRQLLDQPPV